MQEKRPWKCADFKNFRFALYEPRPCDQCRLKKSGKAVSFLDTAIIQTVISSAFFLFIIQLLHQTR
jgi:hypothetical protein